MAWKVWVPRILPVAKETRVRALMVTFFVWPAMFEAFQASININAAPNVPVKKLAASSPALFFGTPLGSSPIMRPAPRMVGRIQSNMTDDLSRHLSEKYPTPRTQIAPIAPLGALKMSA